MDDYINNPLFIFYELTDNSHMTVCAGYAVDGEIRYVYLSDAHDEGYVRQVFSESYNDFISKVELVVEDLEDY